MAGQGGAQLLHPTFSLLQLARGAATKRCELQRTSTEASNSPSGSKALRSLFEYGVRNSKSSDAMDPSAKNPLLWDEKPSGSAFHVALHPLVLLTISDYITRHELRQMEGPVVGILLGQLSGRSMTIEHAFECQTTVSGSSFVLDEDWCKTRLAQSMPRTRPRWEDG